MDVRAKCRSWTSSRWVAISALGLLLGCAGNPTKDLLPGRSTRAEVEQTMGAPNEKLDLAGGAILWFYRRPLERQTYAIRIGKDGVVQAVEERLKPEYIRQIAIGRSRADAVRALIGPPRDITRDRRLAREIWEYDIYNNAGNPAVLWVQFSDDGVVREVSERALPRGTTFSA